MEAQTAENSDTNEALSIEEINRRFDGEWVLLETPWFGPEQSLLGGTLLCHSAQKNEVYGQARTLRPRGAAFMYIGKGDKDMVYLL